jgi:soluble lytic murein transglycosylase
MRSADGANPWRLFQVIRQAHQLAVPEVSARLAVRLRYTTGLPDSAVPLDFLRLEYPIDYVALVDSESSRYGFDPLFFAALIRQESFWDPTAGSGAGALGLTQVIPVTGEAIASALGVEGFTPADLFRPAISLRFGANYIGGQLKRFSSPYHALAAYNAGPANASRWAAASAGATPADFLEAVDFSETYRYVEFVMEHYARYVRAYRS